MRGVTAYKIKIPPSVTFLLTRLMRGVTFALHSLLLSEKFLLTRLMRGVTPKLMATPANPVHFYSHASCEA